MKTFCIVVPVYKNELNIAHLMKELNTLCENLSKIKLTVTFVIDGSPDKSYEYLKNELSNAKFSIKIVRLSRNFGAVIAVKAGLTSSQADYYAVMAADSQEPIYLYQQFLKELESGSDIVVGQRESRIDSGSVKFFASISWWFYRKFIFNEMPIGGVDVFAITNHVRDKLIELKEKNSSLVGGLYWIGFKKKSVPYTRQARLAGKSAWNFFKSLRYFMDSCFNFSDVPIRALWMFGALGVLISIALGGAIIWAKFLGQNSSPGYSMTVVTILFFGSINLIGIGIVGEYIVRAFENSKGRPEFIIQSEEAFEKN